ISQSQLILSSLLSLRVISSMSLNFSSGVASGFPSILPVCLEILFFLEIHSLVLGTLFDVPNVLFDPYLIIP
ncbi:hypothetical protein, partial [Bacillus sp. GbtcB15]|uniref:hypothetical protein n=1 Tax=Bacillus sp. GbtcB15 TaxID=2824760 RepID=UPI001C2F3B5A